MERATEAIAKARKIISRYSSAHGNHYEIGSFVLIYLMITGFETYLRTHINLSNSAIEQIISTAMSRSLNRVEKR